MLAGCSSAASGTTSPLLTPEFISETPQVIETIVLAPPTSIVSNQNLETLATPTPDLRLPPERWMDWPIIPSISARAREIYQNGLVMGNNHNAFSKIGDCQSVPASFLGVYDRAGAYSFSTENQYLQETIEYYQGNFGREGEAVRGGFNTATVLSPMWANTQVCLPGETPIECENRVNNPSIAFISLEVWFSGRTPEVYEKYLRRIIDYNIEQGVLPILATKADNVEGDHSVNYTIAKLAYEYDLPLWNFWLAVQSAPNHGLDPNDTTGFHLNVNGWNIRGFTALQVLDKVRRELEGLPLEQAMGESISSANKQSTASFTPGPLSSLPYSQIGSNSDVPAAPILFDLSTREGEKLQTAGIFQGTINGRDWKAMAEQGTVLLDYLTSGILASRGNNLYIINDDDGQILLTSQLTIEGSQPAIWLKDGRVAAILQSDNGQKNVAIFDPAGGDIITLSPTKSLPIQFHPSSDPVRIYWSTGICSSGSCAADEVVVFDPANSNIYTVASKGQPAILAGDSMVFASSDAEHNNLLTFIVEGRTVAFTIPGNRILGMSWSPDGSTLAALTAKVSDYSGRALSSSLYFISKEYNINLAFKVENEVIEQHAWSPDGEQILLMRRPQDNDGKNLNFIVLDTRTYRTVPSNGFNLIGEKFLIPQHVFWLP
jgi:hypothetical protein